MPSDLWIVPGAPLQDGDGWRVWFSWPEADDPFEPDAPVVTRRGEAPAVTKTWEALEPLPEVGRRAGVMTVEIDPAEPGAAYDVAFGDQAFSWRTLPESIDGGLTFLMGSCFWLNDDREGRYSAGVRDLVKTSSPAFKVLMGDQLYVDWPPRLDGGSRPYLLYAERYLQYWGERSYREMLGSTPTLFACDDHEFWNNFPQRQPQAPWSLFAHEESVTAARDLFRFFQHSANPGGKRFFSLGIGDVSLFVSDTRSERTKFKDEPRHFFLEPQWQELEAWVGSLRGPGLLVLPQPLFQEDGDFKDYALGNFAEDRERLLALFERALDGDTGDGEPHDIAILTGDVHTGRHAVASIAGRTDAAVHEFVASPASLIGPFQMLKKPSLPPVNIGGAGVKWHIELTDEVGAPTVANNVALVRLDPGQNPGTTRLTFELWRVRKYDNRQFWDRLLRRPRPEGDLRMLMRKEVQLR